MKILTLNQKKIVKVLTSLKLDGWTLLIQEEEKSALYLTKGQEIETIIDSHRLSADITVYKKYGKELGDARFTIFDDNSLALGAMVEDALLICSTAKKPAYPLAKRQRYHDVKLSDKIISAAFSKKRTEKVNINLWNKLRSAAKKEKGIVINAMELHLKRTRSTITNSDGVDGENGRTELFIEADFTSFSRYGKGHAEQEFHAAQTVNRLADFDPLHFVRHHAQFARDVLAAERPSSVQESGIVLTGEALRDFWAPSLDVNPCVFHAGAQVKYRQLSRYDVGKFITTNRGFTLQSDPQVPFNPGSSRFDLDGVASRKVIIVENGKVKNYFASQRYGHYLRVPPTGGLGVIELSPGSESSTQLLKNGTVEIVGFSSFSPNSVSGDFSAEIRLGYIRKGGRRIPIRAAMFSGNVFQMLDAMRLSKETMIAEKYKGPVAARFDAGCRLAGF